MKTTTLVGIVAGVAMLAGAFAGIAFAGEVPAQEGIKPAATEYFGVYEELPLTDIAPDGWLRQWLINQKNGLTGHPEVAGWPFNQRILFAEGEPYPPKENVGGGQLGLPWWWAEMLGTYANGVMRCGLALQDADLIARGRANTANALARLDGFLDDRPKGSQFGWSRAMIFRAIMAEYDCYRDQKLLDALHKHLLANGSTGRGITGRRGISILDTFGWAYRRTDDRRLLDQALAIYEKYNAAGRDQIEQAIKAGAWKGVMKGLTPMTKEMMLSDLRPFEHTSCFLDMLKIPVVLYLHSGQEEYLRAAENAYRKLCRKHRLAGGTFVATEDLFDYSWTEGTELCATGDQMLTLCYFLQATEDVTYADDLERVAFNAFVGSVTKDFKAWQYHSGPNQILATHTSYYRNGYEPPLKHAYSLCHLPTCCIAKSHMCMPNYIGHMWVKGKDGAVVAALYGPSHLSIPATGGRAAFEIIEETDYPFSEQIRFRIKTESPVRFPLRLRIPKWCEGASIRINGQPSDIACASGRYVVVDREFKDGDRIELTLPMALKTSRWPDNGIAIERGPLVYSLKIEENAVAYTDLSQGNRDFPNWDFTPASEWRYAWMLKDGELKDRIKVIARPMPANPWAVGQSPIELEAPVVKITSPWDFRHVEEEQIAASFHKNHPEDWWKKLPMGPQHPHFVKNVTVADEPTSVRLVPMGATHLRLTVFPMAPALLQDQPVK